MDTQTDTVPESRPYRRRKPIPPVVAEVPRKPKPLRHPNLAERELDKRLAEAIAERAHALTNVSKLAYWQDRAARLAQEIDSLLNMQQRLLGVSVISPPTPPLHRAGSDPRGPAHSFAAPVPDGITSGPAVPRLPAPTTGNVADEVGSEGGFQ